ncbi:MAG TPA: carboxypeptidase-like regulatory domain-containing protein [Stellaceae bacterium]|nr:carboxypeptidase-like regulatory domain-containing protein [Stellaceae bacterium]
MSMKTWLPLAFGAALLAAPAAAQTSSILCSETDATVNAIEYQARQGLEPPRTQGDVTYLSGGVGSDSVQAMREIERAYNLRLMFAVEGSGEYLADVRVKLVDARGRTVLDAVSDGPYFFARVPPGRYQVVAENEGNAITRSVDVSPGGAVSQSFYWRSAS